MPRFEMVQGKTKVVKYLSADDYNYVMVSHLAGWEDSCQGAFKKHLGDEYEGLKDEKEHVFQKSFYD